MTKQERESLAIAKSLVRVFKRLEAYNGNPVDILVDAKIEANRLPAIKDGLIEALCCYYSGEDYGGGRA